MPSDHPVVPAYPQAPKAPGRGHSRCQTVCFGQARVVSDYYVHVKSQREWRIPDTSAARLRTAKNWLALAKQPEKNAETALIYETPLRAYIRQYSQDECE